MYDYNRISYEGHERARRRQSEAAAERLAHHRASRQRRRMVMLAPALRYLNPHRQGSLETDA